MIVDVMIMAITPQPGPGSAHGPMEPAFVGDF